MIHSLGSPEPGHDSAVPGLEGTSVRVSQPGPYYAGPDVVTTGGGDGYQWLSDALTHVTTVGQIRQVVREEKASNCISNQVQLSLGR